MINPFKKYYTETRSGGHLEVKDSATKIIFDIDSLDYMPIDDRYAAMKKTVLGIDKKIKKCKEDYEKAAKTSKTYADNYCPDEFEVRYNGNEQGIVDDLLIMVQKDIDGGKIGKVLTNEAIKSGIMNNIPIIGDAYTYYKTQKNENVPVGWVASFAMGTRAGALGHLISGHFETGMLLNGMATGLNGAANAMMLLDERLIRKINDTEKIDISPYVATA